MKKILLTAALTMLAFGAAEAQIWKIDGAHSRVEFSVTHLLISEVNGRFNDFAVQFTQGEEDFSGSQIEATIKTASVNTENENRDKHLRSDAFFNADTFPEIKFKSNAFEKTGENTYTITGDLTIRDVTKSVKLDAKLLGTVTDTRGNMRAGFRASATVNRFDYGVSWDAKLDTGGLVVSKDVTITIFAEFVKQK